MIHRACDAFYRDLLPIYSQPFINGARAVVKARTGADMKLFASPWCVAGGHNSRVGGVFMDSVKLIRVLAHYHHNTQFAYELRPSQLQEPSCLDEAQQCVETATNAASHRVTTQCVMAQSHECHHPPALFGRRNERMREAEHHETQCHERALVPLCLG